VLSLDAMRALRLTLSLALSLVVSLALTGCAHDLVDDEGHLRAISKRRIEDDTARRRRLPFLRDVPAQVFTADETDAFVASLAPTPEQDALYTRVNQTLGIQPDGVTYGEIQAEFLRSGVAAIYLPDDGGRMAIFENPMLDQAALVNLPIDVVTGRSSVHGLVVSHEYVHALQDQHFALARLVPSSLYVEDEDRALAKKSLIETEANIVSYAHVYGMDLERVLQRKSLVVGLELNGFLADFTTEAMVGGVPAFIRQSTVRQYDAALAFIDRALAEGGFARLDRVYRDGGPESTEQLLWPDKYFGERDDPTPLTHDVGLPGVSPDARLHGSSFGELQWRVLLSLAGVDGEQAAKGWDGDRYEVWDLGERTLLSVRTTWDSEEDAAEMFDALVHLVEQARYPRRAARVDDEAPPGEQRARFDVAPFLAGSDDEIAIGVRTHAPTEALVWRAGRHVVLVDGAPPGQAIAMGDALLAALSVDAPALEPLAAVALPDPLPPITSPHPLAEQVALAPRTLEIGLSQSALIVDDQLSFSILPNLSLRWAFREGVEFAFPFVLTLPLLSNDTHTTAVSTGVTALGRLSSTLPLALFTVPSELGFALTHQTRAFDVVALTAQVSTRARGSLDLPLTFGLRAGAAASISLLRRVTVNVGAAYTDDLSALARSTLASFTGGHRTLRAPRLLVVGSALERSFVPMPLVEVRVFGGLHFVTSSSFTLDLDAGSLASQRHDLGLLVRF